MSDPPLSEIDFKENIRLNVDFKEKLYTASDKV